MRLKKFIIFILIFTIFYFVGFYIYDRFKNKKYLKKKEEHDIDLINIENYRRFAIFYHLDYKAEAKTILDIYYEIKNHYFISLSSVSRKYNISINEIVTIILFLEYYSLINKRKISVEKDMTFNITESDSSLILKYSLLISNKYEYSSIIQKAGFNSCNEFKYLYDNFLFPGVIFNNNTVIYFGDCYD